MNPVSLARPTNVVQSDHSNWSTEVTGKGKDNTSALKAQIAQMQADYNRVMRLATSEVVKESIQSAWKDATTYRDSLPKQATSEQKAELIRLTNALRFALGKPVKGQSTDKLPATAGWTGLPAEINGSTIGGPLASLTRLSKRYQSFADGDLEGLSADALKDAKNALDRAEQAKRRKDYTALTAALETARKHLDSGTVSASTPHYKEVEESITSIERLSETLAAEIVKLKLSQKQAEALAKIVQGIKENAASAHETHALYSYRARQAS